MLKTPRIVKRFRCAWGVVLLTALAGCSGHLRANFISTNTASIVVQPTDAKVVGLDCDRCTWWVDGDGQLNVAAAFRARSILGERFDRELLVSFVPGEPSQGVGKDYRANLNTVRGYVKAGGNVYRFKSGYGIIGIENRGGEIVGAFRVNILLQGAKLLGGWTRPGAYLIFGTFRAVPDHGEGSTIRQQTEQDGFERTVPASRPAIVR